jgi:ATP-dependent exoDNAse (exonuclease V) alpha subunit
MTQAEALQILKTGGNVFLTGEPGSGKTHLVNTYVRYLRERGIEPAITASTGIAATHLGGMTIHSWSGIGVRTELSPYDLDKLTQNERVVKRVRRARVLIIDEISMLSAQTFALVELACRALRDSTEVFGGLPVVLVGDFFQLPPVSRGEAAQFAYQSPTWRALKPLVCYLSEQHRQEDEKFLALLAALRAGDFSPRHRALLTERFVASDEVPEDLTQLFSHNADVDRLNDAALARLPGATRTFTMRSHGAPPAIESLKKNCLSPETLILKIGAKVMFTKNNPEGRFVNGTTGEIVGWSRGEGWPEVRTRSGARLVVEPAEWVVEAEGRVLASVVQVPLRLAWAITVHKSQGLSLDAAVMDLSQAFEYGQGYVALSRVRTLDGLYLLGLNERALQLHPAVCAEDARFRTESARARETFSQLKSAALETMHHNFLRASGGSVVACPGGVRVPTSPRRLRGARWEPTLKLLKEKQGLAEIARERGLTTGTIFKHLEQLKTLGKISNADLAHLGRGQGSELAEIKTALRLLGAERLAPIHAKFRGKYSYELIQLARLLLDQENQESPGLPSPGL